MIDWRWSMGLGPMALGVMAALGCCVLCLEPKDRHVADVVGSPDLDQRLPTLEAGGSNLGREGFANSPAASARATARDFFCAVIARYCSSSSASRIFFGARVGSASDRP